MSGAAQAVDDPCVYPVVGFETVHGNSDATSLDHAFVCGTAEQPELALVPIQAGHEPTYLEAGFLLRVETDGNVDLACGVPVPALKKDDAIAALLAQKTASAGSQECTDYLIGLDPAWAEPLACPLP